MPMRRTAVFNLLAALAFAAVPARAADTAKPSAEGVEYFEKHVRPILVDTCYKCHSVEEHKSNRGCCPAVDSPLFNRRIRCAGTWQRPS